MKKEDLFDAVTDIKSEYIIEAHETKYRKISRIIRYVGNAAAIIVIAVIILNRNNFFRMGSSGPKEFSADSAVSTVANDKMEMAYSEEAIMEDKLEALDLTGSASYNADDPNLILSSVLPSNELRTVILPEADTKVNGFTGRLLQKVLTSNTENTAVSPLNIYLALGILSEVTDGNTRAEILKVLDASSIEDLRTNCSAVWDSNYTDGEMAESLLGSSIWLNDSISYDVNTLELIAAVHRASSFAGRMGSSSLNESLHNWMNSQTGNLLKDQINDFNLDPETVTAIVTTIYFKDNWVHQFDEEENTRDTFHGSAGDSTTTFMHQFESGTIYTGKNYRASELSMYDGYSMLFILPDEGVTPTELINDKNCLKFILSQDEAPKSKYGKIDYSIPKFDISSQLELKDVMKELGIKDAFDETKADFTPLTTDMEEIFVSTILHGARVKIDENGCEAAAYTAIGVMGATAMPEIMEFNVDRPFIFVIRNRMGVPTFVGIINNIE